MNRYKLYQIKNETEYQNLRGLPYASILEKKMRVNASNYDLIYKSAMEITDTPFKVFSRFARQMPKGFQGHRIEVGDVFVFNQNGTVSAYYVDLGTLIALPGFYYKGAAAGLEIEKGYIKERDSVLTKLEAKKEESTRLAEEKEHMARELNLENRKKDHSAEASL